VSYFLPNYDSPAINAAPNQNATIRSSGAGIGARIATVPRHVAAPAASQVRGSVIRSRTVPGRLRFVVIRLMIVIRGFANAAAVDVIAGEHVAHGRHTGA